MNGALKSLLLAAVVAQLAGLGCGHAKPAPQPPVTTQEASQPEAQPEPEATPEQPDAAPPEPPAPRPTVHLFILTGQSNMKFLDVEQNFLPFVSQIFPDDVIAHIKVAEKGQPIRYWVEEWREIAAAAGIDVAEATAEDEYPDHVYYKQILEQYRDLLVQHPEIDTVTFCWAQGERDAKSKLGAVYEESLQRLIANLRRDLERPDMNVVIARISDFKADGKGEVAEHWNQVREVQVAVARNDPRGAWVDADDCNDKVKRGVAKETLHYGKKGYPIFGERLARQAAALIKGVVPADDGRPTADP